MTKLDKKGAQGQGYGKLGPMDFEFLKIDMNWRRQRGERYVGYNGTADHPGVVNPDGDLE